MKTDAQFFDIDCFQARPSFWQWLRLLFVREFVSETPDGTVKMKRLGELYVITSYKAPA
jgi:hypothetical protein